MVSSPASFSLGTDPHLVQQVLECSTKGAIRDLGTDAPVNL
jgi:hypothetical protein